MSGKLFAWWKSVEAYLDRSLGSDISTPRAIWLAKLHFLFVDHGFMRTHWSNLFEVVPGVWRSNQPSQRRLKKYKDMGFETVVNLRGTAERSPYLLEEAACRELGMKLITNKLSARRLAKTPRLIALLDTFDSIDKPFIMHCKSGADRAGLASALYLLHIENTSIEEAKKQLSFKYLHIRKSKTGVLDYLLDAYAADNETTPMPIREWLETRYHRRKLQRGYRKGRKLA